MNAPLPQDALATDGPADGGASATVADNPAARRERQSRVVQALTSQLPVHALLWQSEDTIPYECDGLTAYRAQPLAVALPETEEQVAAVLRTCHRLAVPVVARGAGTGLSGGRDAAPRRPDAVAGALQPHREDRPARAHRRRAVRCAQPRHQRSRRAVRSLLRAGSVEPDRLHHRRQRGRELGRRALPEVRPDAAQRAEGARLHHRGRGGRVRQWAGWMRRGSTCSASSSAARACWP